MKSLQRQPQYLDMLLFKHHDDRLLGSVQPARLVYRLIVGLAVAAGIFVLLALIDGTG